MKLKSYYMEQTEATQNKPKKKYQSKTKGYSEEGDSFLYNSQQDEQEALGVTSAKYTLESSYESY